MSKSAVYISLVRKMIPLEFYRPILKDAMSRGNIAYFIEEYYDSKEWTEIVNMIHSLIEKNNINELCWFILSKIHAKCSVSSSTDKDIIELSYSMSKELYEKNKLYHFALVCPSDYPEWIYKADYVFT